MHISTKKTILAMGDSHSSTSYGESWPYFLATAWDMDLIRASSCGAGNSFYIEKLHYALSNNNVDVVVIQLTEPSRVVTGFSAFENKSQNNDVSLCDGHRINDIGCYTWNIVNNQDNFASFINETTKIDNVWVPQVAMSKWINYKVMQDIITLQYLCDSFNVPCIFWSWFVPMQDLFIEPYQWLAKKVNWIPDNGYQWLQHNHIKPLPNFHYVSADHSRLTLEWLVPNLKNVLNNVCYTQ